MQFLQSQEFLADVTLYSQANLSGSANQQSPAGTVSTTAGPGPSCDGCSQVLWGGHPHWNWTDLALNPVIAGFQLRISDWERHAACSVAVRFGDGVEKMAT